MLLEFENKMDTVGYNVRHLKKTDKEAFISLWQSSFHQKFNPDIFDWKYFGNGYRQSSMVCETKEGELVGFYGGATVPFQYQGYSIPAIQLTDIMVSNRHKGQSVFYTLGEFYLDYYGTPKTLNYIYGFPNKYHFQIGASKLDYAAIKGGASYFQLNICELLSKTLGTPSVGILKTNSIIENENSFSMIWDHCKEDYPLSVVRTAPFLKWRLEDKPGVKYEIYIAHGKGKVYSYFVLAYTGARVVLLDLLVPNDVGVFRGILKAISMYLFNINVTQLECWFPKEHFISKYIRELGCSESKEVLNLVPTHRISDHHMSPPLNWLSENLYYSMADGDFF